MLGEVYNEKVDVFSFAMCMVELVSQKLPWSGVALGAATTSYFGTACSVPLFMPIQM